MLSFSNHTSTGGFGGIHVRLARAELGLSCMTPRAHEFLFQYHGGGRGTYGNPECPSSLREPPPDVTDGNIAQTNNDHTVLGLRASTPAVTQRLVYRRRARYLESAAVQVFRPLRHDEGRASAAARLRTGRVA